MPSSAVARQACASISCRELDATVSYESDPNSEPSSADTRLAAQVVSDRAEGGS